VIDGWRLRHLDPDEHPGRVGVRGHLPGWLSDGAAGRAGAALGAAAFGSFIVGTMATVGLVLAAPPLARMAIKFGAPEYFALILLGLTTVTLLASGPSSPARISGPCSIATS